MFFKQRMGKLSSLLYSSIKKFKIYQLTEIFVKIICQKLLMSDFTFLKFKWWRFLWIIFYLKSLSTQTDLNLTFLIPQVVFPKISNWLSIFLEVDTLIMEIRLHNLVELLSLVSWFMCSKLCSIRSRLSCNADLSGWCAGVTFNKRESSNGYLVTRWTGTWNGKRKILMFTLCSKYIPVIHVYWNFPVFKGINSNSSTKRYEVLQNNKN